MVKVIFKVDENHSHRAHSNSVAKRDLSPSVETLFAQCLGELCVHHFKHLQENTYRSALGQVWQNLIITSLVTSLCLNISKYMLKCLQRSYLQEGDSNPLSKTDPWVPWEQARPESVAKGIDDSTENSLIPF